MADTVTLSLDIKDLGRTVAEHLISEEALKKEKVETNPTQINIWNYPNALVSPAQISKFTGYSVQTVYKILSAYGAPEAITPPLHSGNDEKESFASNRYFVKEIVQYFEKCRRSKRRRKR